MEDNVLGHTMDDGGMKDHQNQVNAVLAHVNRIEQKVNEIEKFYLNMSKKQTNNSKGGSASKDKDKDKERHVVNIKNQPQDAASREAAASKRMQELMRQFGAILLQITQHKWAFPFMEPVDVKGLGLHDYYEVIEKPMDLGTIKKQMEAKDGSGYKHVREIFSDVRLVFKNAMKYNDEKNEFHIMGKTLLAKFEEKWLQILPKVVEEEKRLEVEESEAQSNMQLAQEAAYAKMAKESYNALAEADMNLRGLREQLIKNCRKMSTEEKRQLGIAVTRLSTEDVWQALEIVSESNPGFMANTEEVDLDIDAQSESTLWRLRLFVKDALNAQRNPNRAASVGGNNNNNNNNIENNNKKNVKKNVNNKSKRKKEICAALAKTAKKSKKLGS